MPSPTKIQTGFLEPQGAFELTPGTSSSPGLFFTGDTSTGMFSPSSGVLGFSTGSTQQALTILADGNVGVGNTNPDYKLDVNGDINFTGTLRKNGNEYVSGIEIKKETASIATGVTSLNFIGTSVSEITEAAGVATINISGGSATPDISPVMMGMIF